MTGSDDGPATALGLRRALLALALSAGLGLAAVASAAALNSGPPAPLSQSGSWTMFCDNTGGCGLANISPRREARSPDPDGARAGVCIWLGAVGDADARFSILLEPPGAAPAAPPAIAIEGGAGVLGVARAGDDDRHEIAGAEVAAIARAIAEHHLLILREPEGGPVHERLSLAGFARALRGAEAGRTAAPPAGEILPRAFVPVARRLPPGLRSAHREWCPEAPLEPASARAYRLSDGSHLWTAGCGRSLHNPSTLIAIEAEDGATRGLQLPSVVDHDLIGPVITNLVLDPARGRMEDLFRSRGLSDCGTRRAWVWDGGRFALASEHTMPNCFGAGHGRWLRMWVTPVRGEPPPPKLPC